MAQETIKGWGGRRENQTGRPVKVPSGDGPTSKITVSVSTGLLAALRKRWPELTDQDILRAALWEAVGEPKV